MANYSATFKLTNPVIDFEAAKNYLKADNMTEYLKDDKGLLKCDFKKEDIDAILNIEWKLYDINRGEIVLTTSKLLTERQLEGVSRWIGGQNSDGLGEGFEQQDFACYQEDDDWFDDDDEFCSDDVRICAAFDWETNDYKLELIR